jgi:hypothetical protein
VLFQELVDCNRSVIPEYGTPHPNKKRWPNHKLVFVAEGDTERENVVKFFYAADRADQDLYNFSYSKADIGGVKFDSVTRRYVFPRTDFQPEDIAAGDQMPSLPAGVFDDDYILTERVERPIGQQELDSLYIAEDRTFIRRTTLTQRDFDEPFSGVLMTVQSLHYLTETFEVGDETPTIAELFSDEDSAFWYIQSDGTVREGRQLSSNWYALTTRNVVPKSFATNGRSYQTSIDFGWPAVLEAINIDSWDLRAGGADRFVRPDYKRAAYRGPCAATVTETFHTTPPVPSIPQSILPLPITLSTPFLNYREEPTLHTFKEIDMTTGSNHPTYRRTDGKFTFQRTEPYQDWPDSVIASDEVRPMRGGYLRTRVIVYRPNIPALL